MLRLNSIPVVTIAVLGALLPFVGARSSAAATADTTTADTTAASELMQPWQPGRQWMSFRAGYAKSLVKNGSNGSIGGGMGYSRMLHGLKIWRFTPLKRYSLGGYAQFDQLGRFGDAAEMEVSGTLELVRHYRLASPYLRPYLGIGSGGFFRKLYRTGHDIARMQPGVYAVFGANTPIDPIHVLGIDMRLARVNGENLSENPVFGPGKKTTTHWSVKLDYSLTY